MSSENVVHVKDLLEKYAEEIKKLKTRCNKLEKYCSKIGQQCAYLMQNANGGGVGMGRDPQGAPQQNFDNFPMNPESWDPQNFDPSDLSMSNVTEYTYDEEEDAFDVPLDHNEFAR